jgi:hypothetical protein
MPKKRLGLLFAAAASTLSCAVLIDTKDSQCTVDADCANLGTNALRSQQLVSEASASFP